MSIIYDALKKTQVNVPQSPPGTQPSQAQGTTKKKFPRLKAIFITLGALFLGIISWLLIAKADLPFLYTKFILRKKAPIQKRYKPRGEAARGNKNAPSSRKTRANTPAREGGGKFILEGILLSQDQNTALINGQVCSVGNEINGAKVVAINDSQVILSYNNQELILDNK